MSIAVRIADPSLWSGMDEEDPGSVSEWTRKMGKEMGEGPTGDLGNGGVWMGTLSPPIPVKPICAVTFSPGFDLDGILREVAPLMGEADLTSAVSI